jgi:hypothetical protein
MRPPYVSSSCPVAVREHFRRPSGLPAGPRSSRRQRVPSRARIAPPAQLCAFAHAPGATARHLRTIEGSAADIGRFWVRSICSNPPAQAHRRERGAQSWEGPCSNPQREADPHSGATSPSLRASDGDTLQGRWPQIPTLVVPPVRQVPDSRRLLVRTQLTARPSPLCRPRLTAGPLPQRPALARFRQTALPRPHGPALPIPPDGTSLATRPHSCGRARRHVPGYTAPLFRSRQTSRPRPQSPALVVPLTARPWPYGPALPVSPDGQSLAWPQGPPHRPRPPGCRLPQDLARWTSPVGMSLAEVHRWGPLPTDRHAGKTDPCVSREADPRRPSSPQPGSRPTATRNDSWFTPPSRV